MNPFYSIRTKLLAVVVLTTFCALLVTGVIIFLYDLTTYRAARVSDMSTQLELLAFSTAPALQFRDETVAQENLNLLQIRSSISAAGIYDANGLLFASYLRQDEKFALPAVPQRESVNVQSTSLEIWRQIVANGEVLGTAYMRADYQLRERALGFIGILGAVALGAMLLAMLMSVWLQTLITRPVLSIVRVARDVVSRKDYTRRAEKLSDDEVGVLVDAFNDMLDEIDSRTRILENTNLELELEVNERKRAREEVLWLNEELKKRVEELRERDKHKDDFLATLAHELRNPLAPIRSGLEAIRKVDERKRENIFGILERQTHQLVRLVDDLMDVSRISRGKVSLKKEIVALEEILQTAIESTSDLMLQKQHHLQISLPSEPVMLYGDSVRLTQVFLNLLSNAAHYTHAGGTISLQAQHNGHSLEVVIEDNGIGMSEEMLEKVFEAFVQIESPLTRSRSGLGIGLTLARALIEKHDGYIRAESAGPGKGMRFVVVLPLLHTEQKPIVLPVPNADHHDKKRWRILVVDDNEDAAMTLGMLLQMEGHEIKVTFDGRSAIAEVEKFKPQVILMDLGMPGMNGIETAREIRRLPNGADMILVAVTGWGQDEDKRKTREAGFDYHLVKPVQAADIQALLARLELEDSAVATE